MTVLNLSFAGSGFMGIYHLGAAEALLRRGDKLLGSLRACAGASAGSLVAAVMITAPDKLEECKEFTYKFAESVRQRRCRALPPGSEFMHTLREGIEGILPGDSHVRAADRLHVSITQLKCVKNHLISGFTSREDLIEALLASSFVPVYAGLKPVEFRGQKWIDGGFTDNLPILPAGRTITVCPFAGSQDVCPVHTGRCNMKLRLANMSIMFSRQNFKRLNQALCPPSTSGMQSIYKEGFNDALRFLEREKLMS